MFVPFEEMEVQGYGYLREPLFLSRPLYKETQKQSASES